MTPNQLTFGFLACVLIIAGLIFGPEIAHNQDATLVDFEHQREPSHKITITKSSTDERGLTSIQFTQDGIEWGLDYLTKRELDSLKALK